MEPTLIVILVVTVLSLVAIAAMFLTKKSRSEAIAEAVPKAHTHHNQQHSQAHHAQAQSAIIASSIKSRQSVPPRPSFPIEPPPLHTPPQQATSNPQTIHSSSSNTGIHRRDIVDPFASAPPSPKQPVALQTRVPKPTDKEEANDN